MLQALSNLMFMWVAVSGKDYVVIATAVAIKNTCGGMGTALLSSLVTVRRVYVGPTASYLTDPKELGMAWAPFFFVTFLVSLPGLAMPMGMRGLINKTGGVQ
jgi:PAT family beta-lactamase induction signal transducer AmpG